MSIKKSKRWNGELDSLLPDFLKEVIEKMNAYGDRVQFESPGKRGNPCYQVINARELKMGFDNRHMILRLNPDGHVAEELSPVFTLEAVQATLVSGGRKTTVRASTRGSSGASATRSSTSRNAAAAIPTDTIEQDKYAYFKSHRGHLPDGIAKYSQDVSQLMQNGMSAEQAFEAIIKKHF